MANTVFGIIPSFTVKNVMAYLPSLLCADFHLVHVVSKPQIIHVPKFLPLFELFKKIVRWFCGSHFVKSRLVFL